MNTPSFAPVPVRARHDGWTPATQVAFIAALTATRNVAAACRAVGRSWQTAYRLRDRPDAAGFAAAWQAALAGPDLSRPTSGRAVDGTPTPIMWRGARVGERRRYDDRLAMYLLRRLAEPVGVMADECSPNDRAGRCARPAGARSRCRRRAVRVG